MSIDQRLNAYIYFIKKNVTNLSKELGVSQSSLSKVANGENLPSAKILIPLSNKGLNVNWLLTGKGEMIIDQNMTTDPGIEYQTKRKGDPETFQDAIKQFYNASEDLKESWEKLLHEKDLRLEEKERIIQTKDKMIEILEAKSQS